MDGQLSEAAIDLLFDVDRYPNEIEILPSYQDAAGELLAAGLVTQIGASCGDDWCQCETVVLQLTGDGELLLTELPADQHTIRHFHLHQRGEDTLLVTKPRPMGNLRVGDVFVGPDEHTVYQVIIDCDSHPNGWLVVNNLSMTDAEAAQLLATPGAVEPGCGPRDGLFPLPPGTTVYLVVEHAPIPV